MTSDRERESSYRLLAMRWVVLGIICVAASAAADDGFFSRHWSGTTALTRTPFLYEAHFVVGSGGYLHSPGVAAVPLTGIHVSERAGLLSQLLVGLFGNALQGLGSVRLDNFQTTTTTEIIGSKKITTTTTTGTITAVQTPAELETDQRVFRDSVAGLTWLDLTVYGDSFFGWNRGTPGGAGYEFAIGIQLELFAMLNLPVVLDLGFQLANVRVPRPPNSGISDPTLYWASGGIVARFWIPLTRLATLSVEWVLNFLSVDYALLDEADLRSQGRVVSSPLKLGVDLYATDHVVLRAQAILGGLGFSDGRLGWMLSGGFRL